MLISGKHVCIKELEIIQILVWVLIREDCGSGFVYLFYYLISPLALNCPIFNFPVHVSGITQLMAKMFLAPW